MNAKKTDAAEIALVPPEDVDMFTGLLIEAQTQRAKIQEELEKRELALGKTTSDMLRQNYEGMVMQSLGAAAGKWVFDALAKKTEDARKALDSAWPCGPQPAKNN